MRPAAIFETHHDLARQFRIDDRRACAIKGGALFHAGGAERHFAQIGLERHPARSAAGRADEAQPAPAGDAQRIVLLDDRSEEHTSELQSLMRTSYAVFCLKKKRKQT